MKFNIKATYEGPDFEALTEMAQELNNIGTWEVNEITATCSLNVNTIEGFIDMLTQYNDNLTKNELTDILSLYVNQEVDVERGWGCTYNFKRTA